MASSNFRKGLKRSTLAVAMGLCFAGGVQAHVLQLAEVYIARGHHVSVLAPSSPGVELPE